MSRPKNPKTWCEWCGNDLAAHQQRFCSIACRVSYQNDPSIIEERGNLRLCASCGTALPKSKRAYCNDTCRRNHREKERAVFRTRVFRMKGYLDPREIATVLRADIKTVRAALAVADIFKGVAL